MKIAHPVILAVVVSIVSQMLHAQSAPNWSFPNYTGAIIAAAVGVGAGIGTGIYLVHRSHTSLTGCVKQTGDGFGLTTKDGSNYELMNAPSDLMDRRRVSLRGHKVKVSSGHAFRVDHLSRDHGACD